MEKPLKMCPSCSRREEASCGEMQHSTQTEPSFFILQMRKRREGPLASNVIFLTQEVKAAGIFVSWTAWFKHPWRKEKGNG